MAALTGLQVCSAQVARVSGGHSNANPVPHFSMSFTRIVSQPRAQQQRRRQPLQAWRGRRAEAVVVAAAAPAGDTGAALASAPHLQLATARLPAGTDRMTFIVQMYQWASTLTTNGRNLPFALPLRCDPLPDGFQISLLRVTTGGSVGAVADIVASVEGVPSVGDVLMVRMYEGEASNLVLGAKAAGSDSSSGGASEAEGGSSKERLETLLSALVDVPLIMQTMPAAIKRAVMVAR